MLNSKENEKKRKKEEAETAFIIKAIKKEIDAAKNLVEVGQQEKEVEKQEKECAMVAVAKLMEGLQNRSFVLSQPPNSDQGHGATAQLTSFLQQQSAHPIMSAGQHFLQPSYLSIPSGQPYFPLPFMPTQTPTPTPVTTDPSSNLFLYEMMR